jgi:hypothetical protein
MHPRRIAAAVAATASLAIAAPAAFADVNYQIPLSHTRAFPTAAGSAQYQAQPGQRELQAEVEHLRRFAGARITFSIGRTGLGSAVVNRLGYAEINRNTDVGQPVPTITHGSVITVRTASGTLIATGRF